MREYRRSNELPYFFFFFYYYRNLIVSRVSRDPNIAIDFIEIIDKVFPLFR